MIETATKMATPSNHPVRGSWISPITNDTSVAINKILKVASSNCSIIKEKKVFGGSSIGRFFPKTFYLREIVFWSYYVFIPCSKFMSSCLAKI